jgi:hypothetical protein
MITYEEMQQIITAYKNWKEYISELKKIKDHGQERDFVSMMWEECDAATRYDILEYFFKNS